MASNSSSISTGTSNNIDQSEAIKVVVRIRPMQKQEKQKGEKICVKPLSLGKEVQIKTDLLEAQIYKCNHCFSRDTSQSKFFEESNITSLIDSAISGYRSCAFAFGQTGAGKTYTVVGPSKSISPGHENDGLIGRSLDYLYNQLKGLNTKFSVRLSCLEIYHENVYDLLSDERNRPSLAIREHSIEGFFLEGCKMVSCQTFKQACSVIDIAMRNRHIGEHELNARSSRSHCITEIYIDLPNRHESPVDNLEESEEIDHSSTSSTKNHNSTTIRQRDFVSTGKLTLVDLAGSERLKSTHSTGKVLQDAGYINKSLYVLGKVIAGLARTHGDINHRDVPYRDSKLTKILINSLGGRGRTLLIACVTEASGSQAETLRTLKFSMSCARIKNRPVKFLDPQEKLITELREEIKRLRLENKKLRSSLLSAPSDSRRLNKTESPNDIDNESLPFRRAISAEENLTNNNNKKIKSNSKTKKSMKNNYSDSVIRPSDDRTVHSPTDQRIRILEERLATLEFNKQSKSKPYSLSPDSNDKVANRVLRNQVQHVDAADLLEQRNKKKIKFISNYEKSKNEIVEKPANNQIMKSQPNSNKLKSIPKSKPKSSNENESHTVSGDILAEYLNSVDFDEDDNDNKKKKKKVNKESNANGRNNNISKKVSPYVAHLASNPKRIKEIITDRAVPIKSRAIPYSDKRAYSNDDESNDKLYKIEKKVNSNELPNIKIPYSSPSNNQIIKEKEIENVLLPSISPKQSPFKLSPNASKNINKFNLENDDHSIERVTTKLTELEKQLINTRQEMEDSPGDVTADAENNLLKLEREVVEMKRELQLSMPNSPVKIKAISPKISSKSPISNKNNKDEDDDYYDETFDNNEDNNNIISSQIEPLQDKSNVNDNIIMTSSSPKAYIENNEADSKGNRMDLSDSKKSITDSTNDNIINDRIVNNSESKANESNENNSDNYYDDSFADVNQNEEVVINQLKSDNADIESNDNLSYSNSTTNKTINGFAESKRNETKDEIKDEDVDHYGYEDDFDD